MPIGGNTPRQLARQWSEPAPTGYLATSTSTATVANAVTRSNRNQPCAVTSTWITADAYAIAGAVWSGWNGSWSNTAATNTAAAYTITVAANSYTWSGWNEDHHAVAESEAQRAARLEADRIERERRGRLDRATATERAEVRRVAILKADKLLESVLSSVQRDQLKKLGGFVLRGQSGQLYRIRMGRSANVDVLDAQGNVVDRLCAHPAMNVPDQDTMVAQKVMLECDEAVFLRMANRHGPPFGQRVPVEALA